jgi:hypothetical protein
MSAASTGDEEIFDVFEGRVDMTTAGEPHRREHQLLVHLEAGMWLRLREAARADESSLADVVRRALIEYLSSEGSDVEGDVQ